MCTVPTVFSLLSRNAVGPHISCSRMIESGTLRLRDDSIHGGSSRTGRGTRVHPTCLLRKLSADSSLTLHWGSSR